MNKLLIIFFVLFFAGCASVPITNRKQVSLVPESQLIASSNLAYKTFLGENNVVSLQNGGAQMVKRVGNKLANACKQFLADYGGTERISGYEWEFSLVDSPEINAWCMPGGKVVVYSGILNVTQTEEGLATVLGHEIAHAIARHSNEQVSQQILAQAGGSTLDVVLSSTSFSQDQLDDLIYSAYAGGTNLGLLNFSRNHELEADKMGLVFMEYAGYDANSAIAFWQRMAAQSSANVPAFLSTHPTDAKRILNIQEYIPVAKSYVK